MSTFAQARGLLRGPDLPTECRATFARHLTYAVLDAVAAGILANAPLMALKGMGSPDWQMAIQMVISSVGMFAVLYIGGWMARRRKMPFVVAPGLAYATCSLGMAAAGSPVVFLLLAGVGMLFETISRPAVAAVMRVNYPPTHRGAAAGEVRGWCSIAFLGSCLLSAWLLDSGLFPAATMIRVQLLVAALLSAAGFFVFGSIRVRDELEGPTASGEPARPMREALAIARSDTRFRRYLLIGGLYAAGGMAFASFVPVLVGKQLAYGYFASALLLHVIPGVLSFLSTGRIGRFVDRANPWRAWVWIRLGWGLDPLLLAATPALAVVSPPAAFAVASLARVSRGLVQGGSWILWWQVGVNHFAAPGADTTRYQGMVLFVNGLARLLAPAAGAWMLQVASIEAVMLAGSGLVLTSALLSAREYQRERHDPRLSTIAAFESRGK